MPSVLFVCTGNQYRSPIAAAAFRRQLERMDAADGWIVSSAGTWTVPGLLPPLNAMRTAEQFGLNISSHRTSLITADELSKHDLILVMEQGHQEAIAAEFPSVHNKLHLISEVVDHLPYDIPDPADPRVDVRVVARQLCDLIERGYKEICRLAESSL